MMPFAVVHAHVVDDPGVPAWWPMFCMAYVVAAGAWLAGMLATNTIARCPASSD